MSPHTHDGSPLTACDFLYGGRASAKQSAGKRQRVVRTWLPHMTLELDLKLGQLIASLNEVTSNSRYRDAENMPTWALFQDLESL